jgi:hypothetical protein
VKPDPEIKLEQPEIKLEQPEIKEEQEEPFTIRGYFGFA